MTKVSNNATRSISHSLISWCLVVIGPAEIKSSVSDFERALKDLYIEGGGDCPESSIGGIKMALEVSHPKSFIFVFTDAPPKDVQKMDDVVDLVQATQSKVSNNWRCDSNQPDSSL